MWNTRKTWLAVGVLAAAMLLPGRPAEAAPPILDPAGTVDSAAFNQRGSGWSDIYMNRNQLLVRITGCEYDERVTESVAGAWSDEACDDGGNDPRHWRGSGMGFIEDIVNRQLLGASVDVSSWVAISGYTHLDNDEPVFRNYVDLVLKRILDADTLTPIDYDPHTFRMVDHFNPSTTTPVGLECTGAANPTTVDTNCDGVSGGWEFGPFSLLSLGCIAIPIIGDVCVNTYLINVDPTRTVDFYPFAPTYVAPSNALFTGTPVNNIGYPLVDFDSFDPADQLNTSHLFLAGQPQKDKTFNAEVVGCDGPMLLADAIADDGPCPANPYRDDDDGLYIELALTNFKLGLLFEPPFNEAAMGTSAETDNVWNGGAGNEIRHDTAQNIQRIPENGTVVQPYICPDGSTINVDNPSHEDYDPACDLSRYLKATGEALIPVVRLGASMRIVSNFNYFAPDNVGMNVVEGYNIILGIEMQSLEIDAQFQFAFWSGPYCTSDLQGQDGVGVFYDRTDNPNNCDTLASGAAVASAFDDATYLVSEQFTESFPWLRAELSGRFQDLFDPATNPGWFLGPTQLPLGLSDFLRDPVFDHPLAATAANWETDNVFIQAMIDSNVDDPSLLADMVAPNGNEYGPLAGAGGLTGQLRGDNTGEFWADPWGVLIPLNASLGLHWTQDDPARTQMVSCVRADPAFTGYIDGIGGDPQDDPYVSRPLPRLDMNWSGSDRAEWPPIIDPTVPHAGGTNEAASYDSMLLHLKIPDVNGAAPFTNPVDLAANAAVVPAIDAQTRDGDPIETYAFGVAVHQNMLSKALYEAVVGGLLCLDFDAVDGKTELQRDIGEILTTDTFGFFVPYLSEQYPGEQMALRIIPLLQNPQGGLYARSAADYPSKISQFVAGFNASADTTDQNPIPRIHTGGINQYDALKDRFRGEMTSLSIQNFWPDLSIVIPHLLAEFYVWDTAGGTPVRKRAFALDLGINVGLNIDILMDIRGTGQQITPLESGGFPVARPQYRGTDFPIGCRRVDEDPTFPYPCEITGVPSRWVVFLGGLLDPELNAILVYDEMADQIVDFAGAVSNVSGNADATGDGDPNTGYQAYEAAISNLIGMLLSGELTAFAEIGIDLAALLNLPIVISVPYIGPSFVWNDSESVTTGRGIDTVATTISDEIPCGRTGAGGAADTCADPVFTTGAGFEVTRDVSDSDLNGFGDYLVIAAGMDLSYLDSNYLLRFIDSFVEPLGVELIDGLALGYEYCDGVGADGSAGPNLPCISETFNNTLLDLVGGFGAPAAHNMGHGFPRGYESPETIIKGVRKAHALETLIDIEGWHPSVPADQLAFSYRVNGGLWTPFIPASTLRIPGLLEGRHVLEVRAKDPAGNVEYTPERVEFVVDSVAPRISIQGQRIQRGTTQFVVDTRDAQTLPEDTRISWRLNDGSWSDYTYSKDVRVDAPVGRHTLQVRAMDEAGNVGLSTLTFAVEKGGFGCAVAAPGADYSGMLDLMALLLVPALALLRRRRRA